MFLKEHTEKKKNYRTATTVSRWPTEPHHYAWKLDYWNLGYIMDEFFFNETKNNISTDKQEAAQQQKNKLPPFKISDKQWGQLQKSKEPTNLVLKDHFAKPWAALLAPPGTHLKG